MAPRPPDDYAAFVAQLRSCFDVLKRSLSEAIDEAVPTEGRTVRSCARQLDLKRGLVHKLMQLASTSDPGTCLGVMPGASAWRTIVEALAQRGVAAKRLTSLETAVQAALRAAKVEPARRWMLQLAAAGALDSAAEQKVSLGIRRSGFDAASAVLGLSARARVALFVLAPSSVPDRVDLLQWTVFEGLRRHRPGQPWRLVSSLPPPNAELPPGRVWSIVDAGDRCPLVPDLSSPAASGSAIVATPPVAGSPVEGSQVALAATLGDRPDSNAELRATFAAISPQAGPAHADSEEDLVHLEVGANLPLEWLMLEILIDRRLELGTVPVTGLFASRQRARADGRLMDHRLPVEAAIEEMEPDPSSRGNAFGLPKAWSWFRPLHAEILDRSNRMLGGEGSPAERFRCWRVAVAYPHSPSLLWAWFRMPLHDQAATSRRRRKASRGTRRG